MSKEAKMDITKLKCSKGDSVGRRSGGLHIASRIDWGIVQANFVVNVRARGTAADSSVTNDLSALDARAGDSCERGHMRVPGRQTEAMINDNQASIPGMVFHDGYDAIRCCVNWRAVIGCNINAGVERAFPAEWIKPLTKAVGDMSQDRPNRWRVT